MLESIRQFGQEEVERTGEQAAAGETLVTWALVFSRHHGEIPAGSEKAEWLAALAREEPNLAAAIEWLFGMADYERLFELVVSRGPLWWVNSRMRAGRTLLERVLVHGDAVSIQLRGRALRLLGFLNYHMGDLAAAKDALEPAARLLREAGDDDWLCRANGILAEIAYLEGHLDDAIAVIEETIAIAGRLEDHLGVVDARIQHGRFVLEAGDLAGAAAIFRAAITECRSRGYEWSLGTALICLGDVCAKTDEQHAAVSAFREAVELFDAAGDPWGQTQANLLLARQLADRDPAAARTAADRALGLARDFDNPLLWSEACVASARVALAARDLPLATSELREALTASRQAGVDADSADVLAWIAVLADRSGNQAEAFRLLGGSDSLAGHDEEQAVIGEGAEVASLRQMITRDDPDFALDRNRSRDEAIASGLEFLTARTASMTGPAPTALPSAPQPVELRTEFEGDLTVREVDVLRLVARGRTNAEIGNELFISPLTAKTHVANLLGKLALENRAAAAAWAAHRGIV